MQVARAVLVSPFSSNVSFSLRTKYNTILYIYELLYYFRAGSLIMNDYLVIPNPTPTPISIRRRRRPSRPPTYPKKFKTGYLYYFTEQFSKMKPSTFEMGQELAKKIGYQWRNLSPSEKSVWVYLYIYIYLVMEFHHHTINVCFSGCRFIWKWERSTENAIRMKCGFTIQAND